jgi:hypothetical protein
MASGVAHSVHADGDEQLASFVFPALSPPGRKCELTTKPRICHPDRSAAQGSAVPLHSTQNSNRTTLSRSDDPIEKSKWQVARCIQSTPAETNNCLLSLRPGVELQIPPLRYASVGMTKFKACFLVCICDREGEGLALNPQTQHSNRTDAFRSDDTMQKSKWEMAKRIC